ncbi:MAG: hypothetical protein J0I40_13420 [Cellulomonas sp.]|uniref:hypothetical protein n=1 Tax=Cellulomonas sp. 73-92 TaxID=1895740 RepID=UPI00092A0E4D|nr:hypothetical protein [Cellulomonas sp. 73-92]MBN9376361.1 hypothetical protein [Cellulomonas sp.]OJV80878.1 MAG: hypothetical protein BGO37_15210 [Cellulomonas sp. 73-92]
MRAVVGCGAILLAGLLCAGVAGAAVADETPPPDLAASTPPFETPIVRVSCANVTVFEAGSASRVRISSTPTDPEAGPPWPANDQSLLPEPMVNFSGQYDFANAAWSWNWTVDVWDMGGGQWTASGTTTPCPSPPYIKGYLTPARPTVNAICGATLDDVHFPMTRHITYWHDATAWYATAERGWTWAEGSLGPPHVGWIPPDNVPSNQVQTVHIDGYDLLRPPAGCGHMAPGPYDPQPAAQRSTAPRGDVAASSVATSAPTTPSIEAAGTTATATATPAPSPAPTAASPSPSPTATPATHGQHGWGTTTGIGVAGGVAGASVLAAAGAFVVRRRLRPTPNGVVLDESGEPETLD